MKKAFITGINGQDGSYLAEYLLGLGYEVHGIVRRNSTSENQSARLKTAYEKGQLTTHYGDLSDQGSIERLLEEIQPDEIYNIAAQSHVRVSFDVPQYTVQTNAVGVLNVLEAYRRTCPKAKFYQASSSEMFGLTVEDDGFQRETSVMNPVSPYGCSKVFGYNVKAACSIKLGLQDKLELGNMDSYRDWGHSKDYVRAMHAILNHDEADDFVVSTMETHSVREMCELVFKYLDLDYRDYVVQNPKFLRPEELPYLKGDSTKIRETLGWKPEYTFEAMMHEMCDHWMDVLQGKESLR